MTRTITDQANFYLFAPDFVVKMKKIIKRMAMSEGPNKIAINDEAAALYAQELIARCEALPLGESVIFSADTELTEKAVPIIDAHFGISGEGRPLAKDPYTLLFSGSGRIQKRYQMNLKTVHYDNFF